jgi:hypothetical protein
VALHQPTPEKIADLEEAAKQAALLEEKKARTVAILKKNAEKGHASRFNRSQGKAPSKIKTLMRGPAPRRPSPPPPKRKMPITRPAAIIRPKLAAPAKPPTPRKAVLLDTLVAQTKKKKTRKQKKSEESTLVDGEEFPKLSITPDRDEESLVGRRKRMKAETKAKKVAAKPVKVVAKKESVKEAVAQRPKQPVVEEQKKVNEVPLAVVVEKAKEVQKPKQPVVEEAPKIVETPKEDTTVAAAQKPEEPVVEEVPKIVETPKEPVQVGEVSHTENEGRTSATTEPKPAEPVSTTDDSSSESDIEEVDYNLVLSRSDEGASNRISQAVVFDEAAFEANPPPKAKAFNSKLHVYRLNYPDKPSRVSADTFPSNSSSYVVFEFSRN